MSQVVIYGDNCIDTYWVGQVKGLSAEAPVPVLKQQRMVALPGMAGNVQALLQGMGQSATLVQSPTPHLPIKNRLVTTEGVQLARWDIQDWCTPYTEGVYVDNMDPEGYVDLPPSDNRLKAIIVADYGKGAVTSKLIEDLLDQASKGIPLYVDTKGDPFTWMGTNITLFPNAVEYATWKQKYDWMPSVVLKLGGVGMQYLSYGQILHSLPARCSRPLNVCGAGDSVIAAFVRSRLLGLPTETSLELANIAAGLVVSQPFDQRYVTWEAIANEYTSPRCATAD